MTKPGGTPQPAARGTWHADVFLDTFEMSHTLDLGTRLEARRVRWYEVPEEVVR